jgi:hypothetical protein
MDDWSLSESSSSAMCRLCCFSVRVLQVKLDQLSLYVAPSNHLLAAEQIHRVMHPARSLLGDGLRSRTRAGAGFERIDCEVVLGTSKLFITLSHLVSHLRQADAATVK